MKSIFLPPGNSCIMYLDLIFILNYNISAGGVVMTGLKGKITVDNTLGARLEIAKEEVK